MDSFLSHLPPNMAQQVGPHLDSWLRRLHDRQIIELAMSVAEGGSIGDYLATTASDPIEVSFARLQSLADHGDLETAKQEAQRLLLLLGKHELALKLDATKALPPSQTGGETAAHDTAAAGHQLATRTSPQPNAEQRLLAEAEERLRCASAAYDRHCEATEHMLNQPATAANIARLQELIATGKSLEAHLHACRAAVDYARRELARSRGTRE